MTSALHMHVMIHSFVLLAFEKVINGMELGVRKLSRAHTSPNHSGATNRICHGVGTWQAK
jgi:hypothetical protein